MCGISGVFGRSDHAVVGRMLAEIRHRGPDDHHVVSGAQFTLGATRLSIVDVEGGRQPMCNERSSVWAAQNGELYNYPRLRPALLKAGHHLHTTCDTEVLPHLYEDYGSDLPAHIDGMFAVAVWDEATQTGLLARDRMGKKPLYYWEHGGALYFASEIKALLTVPGFTRSIDIEALHHYLSLKHVPHPHSIFKGVRCLPPAHRLVFKPGQPPAISRYWDLDFTVDAALAREPVDALVDEFLRLFKQGVKRRFMSDVPIGFFLSGGLDSSLSTAVAAELSGTIKTFTLTYAEGSTTAGKEADRKWARWVADRYRTDHYEETIAFSRYPEQLRTVLRCFDEPFAGVISSFFLSQRIAQHVKVAVSGDGADEIFGSYRSHRDAAQFDSGTSVTAEWRSSLLVYAEQQKCVLYQPQLARQLEGVSTTALLAQTFDAVRTNDPLNRVLEAEFKTIFPDQVLTYVDRLSMAHSLEVRTAYLDTEVVEFVAKLPGALKIRNGETKFLLKQAARRYFPAEMIDRPKEGFLMPVTEWMLGDLQEYVRDTLAPDRIQRQGFFQPSRVQALVDRLYQPGADYWDVNRVLALVVFQEWHDLYMA